MDELLSRLRRGSNVNGRLEKMCSGEALLATGNVGALEGEKLAFEVWDTGFVFGEIFREGTL